MIFYIKAKFNDSVKDEEMSLIWEKTSYKYYLLYLLI